MFNKILATVFAVIATVFMCVNMVKAQVVTEGLVSYWTFDKSDIDGDIAKDVFGNNDGTIMGDPQIVEGKVREALEFDGVDDYVETEPSDTLSLIDACTLESWIKGTGTWKEIANVRDPSTGEGVETGITSESGSVAAAFLGSWVNAESAYTINDDNWHHVVAVVSGTDLTLYVDGESRAEASGASSLNIGPTAKAIVAKHLDAGIEFEGPIDEVRVYNRALSEDEVVQNMNAEGMAVVNPAEKLAFTWGKIKLSR